MSKDQELLTQCINTWDKVEDVFEREVTLKEIIDLLEERHTDRLYDEIPVVLITPIGHGDYIRSRISKETDINRFQSVHVKTVQAKEGQDETTGVEIYLPRAAIKVYKAGGRSTQ